MDSYIKQLRDFIDEDTRMKKSAYSTLENLGYTYNGGELWEPPIGLAPDYIKETTSVFDKPNWVTFNADKDLMGIFDDILEHNKDYKVVGYTENAYIIDVHGARQIVGKGFFFYAREDYKQPVVSEDYSFDNLAYVEPSGKAFIKVAKLTPEQKEFLNKTLTFSDSDNLSGKYPFLRADGVDGWTMTYDLNHNRVEISFNDIFKVKSNG